MSFDEQPDAGVHDECAHEISRLLDQIKGLEATVVAQSRAHEDMLLGSNRREEKLRHLTYRVKELESEVVELRKDAERYRWLRDIGQDVVDVFFVTDKNASGWGAWDSHDDKDAAIDAAMQREKP